MALRCMRRIVAGAAHATTLYVQEGGGAAHATILHVHAGAPWGLCRQVARGEGARQAATRVMEAAWIGCGRPTAEARGGGKAAWEAAPLSCARGSAP
jgi:hypothetical protein